MSEFMQFLEPVLSNGMSVAIIIYFLYKDYKFNDQIIAVLGEVKNVLTKLETWHAREESRIND